MIDLLFYKFIIIKKRGRKMVKMEAENINLGKILFSLCACLLALFAAWS